MYIPIVHKIFHNRYRIHRFIDFASVTTEDLELLTAACDPATFGRGNEDVHDESYRKAVKIDASDFSIQLDLVSSGIMKTLEDQLLQGETEKMRIRAELYKLNVDGDSGRYVSPASSCLTSLARLDKDSFFKPHKDTPRGTDMFGALVVIYPTAHEGGELIFRHEDNEWKFDANSLTASQHSPSLAYVAFYSDIEHEVLKVASGHRVTVTYNLYLVDPTSKVEAPVVIPPLKGASNLQVTLQGLLKSPEFLPDGGTLGFGLVHLYPVTFRTKLRKMASYLKGADAHVYQACRALQLQPSLQVIYDDDESGQGMGIMLGEIARDPHYNYQESSYECALAEELGGVPVNKTERAALEESIWVAQGESEGEFITWISPFNGQIGWRTSPWRMGTNPRRGIFTVAPALSFASLLLAIACNQTLHESGFFIYIIRLHSRIIAKIACLSSVTLFHLLLGPGGRGRCAPGW